MAQGGEATGIAPEVPRRFRLEIVTPERQLVDEEVEELVAPGVWGQFGVLPLHARLMASLGIGELAYRRGDGDWGRLAVAWGFVEVQPDRVTVLAQTAELAGEIDVARAEAARERALRRLAQPDPDTDIDRARASLERALARLQVARRPPPARRRAGWEEAEMRTAATAARLDREAGPE